jgi:hypothetical protein
MSSITDHETKSFFSADKRLLFLLLCLANILLLYIKIALIESGTAAFEFLQDRPEGTILKVINGLKFLAIPVVFLWKFTVIAFTIWVGCSMFGYRVSFVQCWGIVLVAEYIFLLPELVKIVYFMFFVGDPTYHEIRSFYPLAIIQLVDYDSLDKRWAYPLRALNLFEILYWFLLVEGIHHVARKNKRYVWLIVSCSYILLFMLWLLFYSSVYK